MILPKVLLALTIAFGYIGQAGDTKTPPKPERECVTFECLSKRTV